MDKLHTDKLIVVEGKYDKIRLENIIDAPVIAVGGFRVYNDKKLHRTLRELSKNGVIIITDSDSAGYKIRVFLSKILHDCEITDVFVPRICGKEPRKSAPSAQGFLGVEGISDDVLVRCLEKFCVRIQNKTDDSGKITVSDLYALGYTGTDGARRRKSALLSYLGVQEGISNRFLLRILNGRFTRKELADLKLEDK
ncbi:MAG: DUF4093 domain-containing protein [Clostridia bacterium]|nr:DUF4093 domain-containing protein [Clostridia bacterium]